MKKETRKIESFILDDKDASSLLACLRYCRHRIEAHGKNTGISSEEVYRLIDELSK